MVCAGGSDELDFYFTDQPFDTTSNPTTGVSIPLGSNLTANASPDQIAIVSDTEITIPGTCTIGADFAGVTIGGQPVKITPGTYPYDTCD